MAFRPPNPHFAWLPALAGLMTLGWAAPGAALDEAAQIKLGESEYMAQCASCHGAGGQGDGPVAEVLTTRPADLTMISARYEGSFPEDAIYEMIDGRNMINPHGTRGMPVWGDRYFQLAAEEAQTVPHDVDAQALAYGRISALVKYLESIQAE
jgi:mono/diheme cytochrome c family protein